MAERTTIEKADGSKIMSPDYALKEKLGGANMEILLSPEKVKRASGTVERQKDNFPQEAAFMLQAIRGRFGAMKKQFDADGGVEGQDKNLLAEMHDELLNLKSQAGMFGYSLATEIARNLYSYCMMSKWKQLRDFRIAEVHLDALDKVFRLQIQGDGGTIGKEILDGLKAIVS